MIAALGVGSVLAGRYELVRHIARGGMADVYEADDRQLQRAVAIKVFRAGATADRARFDAEVVVLAALNHPGLVQVYDAGEHEGDAFVVLDLVDGPTLAARLAAGSPIPPPEVAEVGAQVADALAYVHDQGVVHRDVPGTARDQLSMASRSSAMRRLDVVGEGPHVGDQLAAGHEADVDVVHVGQHRDVQAGALHHRAHRAACTRALAPA